MWKFALLLVLVAGVLRAQTIMTHQAYVEADTDWAAHYDQADTSVNRVITETFKQILNSNLKKLSKNAQIMMLNVFVGAEGKIDHLVYNSFGDIKPHDIDSIFKSGIREALASWALVGVNRKIRANIFFQTEGLAPTMAKTRGVVRLKPNEITLTSLEDIRKHQNPDSIRTIDLSAYELKEVPQEIYRFKNLMVLKLTGNEIETAFVDLKRLPLLNSLSLDLNPLESVRFSKSGKLAKINLQNTSIERVPRSFRQAKNLESVWLGFNPQIKLKRRDYRRMRGITDLNLYKCSLATIAPSIKVLKKLEVLDLYHNQLETLPQNVTKLKNLTHLAVSNNRLTSLPEEIGTLQNLEYLYLHHNLITQLPEGVGKLSKLAVLDLGYNWFVQYPVQVNQLTDLKEFDLSANKFSAFPEQLLELRNLDKIYLRGNPFLEAPAESQLTSAIETLKSNNKGVVH